MVGSSSSIARISILGSSNSSNKDKYGREFKYQNIQENIDKIHVGKQTRP